FLYAASIDDAYEVLTYNKCDLILLAGQVVVRDIGFSDSEVQDIAPEAYGYDLSDLGRLPKGSDNSNKGTYGR
ncbi:hypothetical protein NE541_15915, partial [Coprococcus eutactus]|nr:hypothetical protein [Coprococcus eutactus]